MYIKHVYNFNKKCLISVNYQFILFLQNIPDFIIEKKRKSLVKFIMEKT